MNAISLWFTAIYRQTDLYTQCDLSFGLEYDLCKVPSVYGGNVNRSLSYLGLKCTEDMSQERVLPS